MILPHVSDFGGHQSMMTSDGEQSKFCDNSSFIHHRAGRVDVGAAVPVSLGAL